MFDITKFFSVLIGKHVVVIEPDPQLVEQRRKVTELATSIGSKMDQLSQVNLEEILGTQTGRIFATTGKLRVSKDTKTRKSNGRKK